MVVTIPTACVRATLSAVWRLELEHILSISANRFSFFACPYLCLGLFACSLRGWILHGSSVCCAEVHAWNPHKEPCCMSCVINIDCQPWASQRTEIQTLLGQFADCRSPVLSITTAFTAMCLFLNMQIKLSKRCDADHHKGCQIYVYSWH